MEQAQGATGPTTGQEEQLVLHGLYTMVTQDYHNFLTVHRDVTVDNSKSGATGQIAKRS